MRLILALLAMLSLVYASGPSAYMALRARHGVTKPATVAALETLVGHRVLEVAGTVNGTMRVGDRTILMLRSSGGGDLFVESDGTPDWLTHGTVAARLLVVAERVTPDSPIRATLLGAAPEGEVAASERRIAPPRPATSARARPTASRGSTRAQDWQLESSEALPYYEQFIRRRNPRVNASEARRIAQGVIGFSLRYGVDARLIMAMVLVESGFDPGATSPKGAMGLGQLMPGTARGLGVSNAYDSIENLNGTVRLVRGHLERYHAKTGDEYRALVLSLAAYNAGSGAVRRHGGVPPFRETQNYIRRVIDAYRQMVGH
jgi:soluble lytic murein transglycosylase-like protein